MEKITRIVCAGMMMSLFFDVAFAQRLTIATVRNAYISQMQDLASNFEKENPDIELNWIFFGEKFLRQRVRADIATGRGQYDIVLVNSYEAPIWAREGWLVSLNDLPASYDIEDIFPSVRSGLSINGNLYAAPFHAEGFMVMYRKDLMKKAGLTMPKTPTWDFIRKAAKAITDKTDDDNQIYGICLRGKAGWSENVAILTAMANSFGAKWFDLDWNPQFDSNAWKETLNFYLNMMEESGHPKAFLNGFSENFKLFQKGKCGIWIDTTAAAPSLTGWKYSKIHKDIGFALAPDKELGKRANGLWTLNLVIPVSSKKIEIAKKFIGWTTSKEYLALLGYKEGWGNVPPSARISLYENPEYAKFPFAWITAESINSTDPTEPTIDPVPYIGAHFVAIPEYQSIATDVAQQFSAALAGKISAEDALKNAQTLTVRIMKKIGYIKQ